MRIFCLYRHTLSYTNNTNCWYTLFLQDDNLEDYRIDNVLLDNIDITFDNDFVRVNASAVGNYPVPTTVTNTVVQPKDFVGRMASYLDDDVPGTVTASTVLGLTASLDFGLNGDDSKFGLGNDDLAVLRLTSDKFMFNVMQLKGNTDRYLENENNTMKQVRIKAETTDRYVASTTVTRPLIQFDVPRAKIENYTEEPNLDDLTRENFDLTALNYVGVSGVPMSITVLNAKAGY